MVHEWFILSAHWRIAVYLVKDIRHGSTFLVFTWEDPKNAGYKGAVIEDVGLDYDMDHVHRWPDGSQRPEACLARSLKDPKVYKVFKYRSELQQQAEYECHPCGWPTGRFAP